MINLSDKNSAADLMFIEITNMEPGPGRSNMIRNFVNVFWSQLSDSHKKAYRECYVNPIIKNDSVSESEWNLGEESYNRGMARQDRMMMDF